MLLWSNRKGNLRKKSKVFSARGGVVFCLKNYNLSIGRSQFKNWPLAEYRAINTLQGKTASDRTNQHIFLCTQRSPRNTGHEPGPPCLRAAMSPLSLHTGAVLNEAEILNPIFSPLSTSQRIPQADTPSDPPPSFSWPFSPVHTFWFSPPTSYRPLPSPLERFVLVLFVSDTALSAATGTPPLLHKGITWLLPDRAARHRHWVVTCW